VELVQDMGGVNSKKKEKTTSKKFPKKINTDDMGFSKKFAKIADRFQTLAELQEGLRECGLESSNLIIAIDFTKSNTWTGKNSFGGFCLHQLSSTALNPYQQVISILGRTLEVFDDDHLIPAFGFGDVTTTDKTCFPFFS